MTTFHSRQTDCARRARKNEYANTFNFTSQIAPSIYTVRHTKRVKTNAAIFKSRCSRTVLCYRFDRVEALPLVRTRFLRLANSSPKTARSPARRSRDGRATYGKTSGAISAQRPGNGRIRPHRPGRRQIAQAPEAGENHASRKYRGHASKCARRGRKTRAGHAAGNGDHKRNPAAAKRKFTIPFTRTAHRQRENDGCRRSQRIQ
jgi:hypothetical protein